MQSLHGPIRESHSRVVSEPSKSGVIKFGPYSALFIGPMVTEPLVPISCIVDTATLHSPYTPALAWRTRFLKSLILLVAGA
jgi:hypothetical protein